jgi:DNA-binding GntR family transcriptional regulator
LAGNRQLDLALEPILLKLQRPMAVNLRREAQLDGAQAGIERHERLVAALATNDSATILAELHSHGTRRFLPRDVAQV